MKRRGERHEESSLFIKHLKKDAWWLTTTDGQASEQDNDEDENKMDGWR